MTGDHRVDAEPIDGRVDQLDEVLGVRGWALRTDDPGRALVVELWAGDRLIETAETGLPRPDVAEALGVEAMPGFRFAEDVGARILAAAEEGAAGDLVVRVAGFAGSLDLMVAPRSLELVRLTGAARVPGSREALLARISQHTAAARELLDQPLRPMPGRGIGFIEAIVVDDAGLTWLTGWMKADPVLDRPVIVLDNGKYPGGFAYVTATRDDLPSDSRGFIGILSSDWRASPDLPPYLFIADGSGRFLESLQPTPIRSKQHIAPFVREVLARTEGGHRDLLREMFHSAHSWAVLPDDGGKDLVHVDAVAVLPGFGAFVRGWSLSPYKTAGQFALKADRRVMVGDERTLVRHSRADLSEIYPGADLAVERAGFIVTFRGDIAPDQVGDLVLKAVWEDGSATNVVVPPERIRVLGVTAPLEQALGFYPAIEAEGFFGDFARHAAAAQRTRATRVQPYAVAPARGALVLTAPATLSDTTLIIEDVCRSAADLPADWGIALIARSDQHRSRMLSFLADLRRATDRPCSLLFVADTDSAVHALPAVAEALGARELGFVGPDAMLTPDGWTALAGFAGGATLLATADLADHRSDDALDAFACDAAALAALARAAEPRIGAPSLGDLELAGWRADRVVADGAWALLRRRPSPLAARINEVDARAH